MKLIGWDLLILSSSIWEDVANIAFSVIVIANVLNVTRLWELNLFIKVFVLMKKIVIH